MTAGQQLTFDLDLTGPGVDFFTVCPRCGELLDRFHLADPGDRWMEPVLWGYVAQAAHDRERHPS